jgi:hypothetical protein
MHPSWTRRSVESDFGKSPQSWACSDLPLPTTSAAPLLFIVTTHIRSCAARRPHLLNMSGGLLDLIPALHDSDSVPHNSLQPEILRVNIAFIVITCTFIILRIAVRLLLVKHVALEDYLMVGAGLFATAFSAMAMTGVVDDRTVRASTDFSQRCDTALESTYGTLNLRMSSSSKSRK